MTDGYLNVAVIGCGNVAARYLEGMARQKRIHVVGIADTDPDKAETRGREFGHRVYDVPEEAWNDEKVDLVVNLTPPAVHGAVITAALEAGRHVYTEKPFTMDPQEGRRLLELAQDRERLLVSAPFTFLGESQSAAESALKSDRIGELVYVSAERHNGPIETWHPAPEAFYQVGPLWDIGLYILMPLLRVLGPVARVTGVGEVVRPQRVRPDGTAFTVTTPDSVNAFLEFENGAKGRLATSFVIPVNDNHREGIEYYGKKGTLFQSRIFDFAAPVLVAGEGDGFSELPFRGGAKGVDWSRGMERTADHLLDGAPNELPIEMALHGITVIDAVMKSAREGLENGTIRPVTLS